MTYEELRRRVVDEEKVATNKQLRGMVFRLALTVLFASVWLGLVTIYTVGFGLFLLAAVFLVAMFIMLCGYASEDEKSFKTVNVVSHFWALQILITIVVFLLLKYFYFI